jgi:hypothetical protein
MVIASSFPSTRSVPVKPLLDKGFREGPNLGWIFEVKKGTKRCTGKSFDLNSVGDLYGTMKFV